LRVKLPQTGVDNQGAITMVIGAVSWFVIVDFPSDATFLTPEERLIVTRRLEADGQQGARNEKFQWSEFRASFTDWKTWTGMVMYMGVDGALYAFSLFLPSIIKKMNFTATKAQLMSVAPYAFACILVRISF
jgi:nitrate/nitrite transporter NarK